jgi:hypothetical protein
MANRRSRSASLHWGIPAATCFAAEVAKFAAF